MRDFVPVLGIALMLSACSDRMDPVGMETGADDGPISFVRNSEFTGPYLRVFFTPDDGTELSVNTAEDAVQTRIARTPIPDHQAQDWTFVKVRDAGTSVVHALVSWDSDAPDDYLMAGWWAEFPDQQPPALTWQGSIQIAIVDGPETDPAVPPGLPPAGQAIYSGQAGGLYSYLRGSDWGEAEGSRVLEEFEGIITLRADFAESTIGGCIGCQGDLVTRRAHFGIFLGQDVRDDEALASGYELHLGTAQITPEGTMSHPGVTVRHPEREVTHTEGNWGGTLSNIPDQAGNPRLAAGFADAGFEEGDGSSGAFFGVYVALSEPFASSGQ